MCVVFKDKIYILSSLISQKDIRVYWLVYLSLSISLILTQFVADSLLQCKYLYQTGNPFFLEYYLLLIFILYQY